MVSISNIKGSNGSGQAVRGAVTNARAISSTTLKVDSVTNYPSQFIATTGKLGPSGILDNTTVQVFFGHLSGADIIIDSFAPGYTDKGNSVADVVILKPTTAWADEVAGVLDVTHNDNGTIKNNAVKTAMLDAANIDASVALKDASVTSSKIDFTTFSGTSTQWRTWTPTLSNHSGTVNVARYTLVGKTCQFYFKVTLTSGASAALNITLPVTASSNIKTGSYGFDIPTIIGHGSMVRMTDNYYALHAYLYNTTSINLGAFVVSGTSITVSNTSATIPKTWASGDNYIISGAYETA